MGDFCTESARYENKSNFQSQDVPGLLYILSGIVCVLSSVLCVFLRETKDRDLDDMIHENTTQKSEKENGNIQTNPEKIPVREKF